MMSASLAVVGLVRSPPFPFTSLFLVKQHLFERRSQALRLATRMRAGAATMDSPMAGVIHLERLGRCQWAYGILRLGSNREA